MGHKISESLLSHGYKVTLTYFRNKIELSDECMSKYSQNMNEIECDVDKFTEKKLEHIIKGHSIVISSIIMGGKTHNETKATMTRVIKKLITASSDSGVKKFILITGAGM